MTRGSLGTAQLGRIGEELAGRALLDLGWRIRHRNLRAPEGELDLVGTDGEVTVVVEVKTGRRPPTGMVPRTHASASLQVGSPEATAASGPPPRPRPGGRTGPQAGLT